MMIGTSLEMAPNPAGIALALGYLAPGSSRIIEKRTLTSAAKLRALGISAAC
jgi:hypothetical protein